MPGQYKYLPTGKKRLTGRHTWAGYCWLGGLLLLLPQKNNNAGCILAPVMEPTFFKPQLIFVTG
jgi:hypothetical protein